MVVGTLSLVQKKSNQWLQWMQCAVDAVHSRHSGIMVCGGEDIVFGAKRSKQWMQWMQHTVDAVNSGCSTYTVDVVDAVE